jgi:Fic family protein
LEWKQKTQDFRRWSSCTRGASIVRLHRKGIKVMQIAALTGLSYPTVRRTIDPKNGSWMRLPVP